MVMFRCGSALVLCASFVTLTGCDGCDETDPGGTGGHGGQGGSPATTGSTTSSGLGGMGTGGAGGSGGDGGGGAAPVDVTVTVLDGDGMAFEAVDLIASDATGALADQSATDATGQAVLSVPAGGYVTMLREQNQVFWRPPSSREYYETRTFAIEPGRTSLQIRTPRDELIPPANAPMPSVSIDVAAVAGATEYRLMLSCREDDTLAAGANAIADYAGCPGESTFDALLAAMDDDGHTLAFAFAVDVPHTPGQSATLALDLGSAPLTPVAFDVTVPGGLLSTNVIAGAYGSEPAKDPLWADGLEPTPAAPTGQIAFPSSYPGPDCWLAYGSDSVSASEYRVWQLFRCDDGTPGDLSWDIERLAPAALALGQKGGASISLLEGETGDGLQYGLLWGGGDGEPFWSWTVSLPAASSVTVPALELPAELAVFEPPASGYTASTANVDLLSASSNFIDVVADTLPTDINLVVGTDAAGTSIFVQ